MTYYYIMLRYVIQYIYYRQEEAVAVMLLPVNMLPPCTARAGNGLGSRIVCGSVATRVGHSLKHL